MLRSKKYNIYKHIGLNHLFDFCVDEPISNTSADDADCVLIDDYINNTTIKSTNEYELVKETILEPYILKLPDILLIHVTKDVIKEFEFLYKKSNKHVFDIYETSQPHMKDDTHIKMYHIFCVSKKLSNELNYMSFLKTNDSDKKYSCLSLFYGPCLIVNRRFDITCEHDKYKSKYKYIKTIGRGDVDNTLRSFIKLIINMTNEYQKMLPPHYLKIN